MSSTIFCLDYLPYLSKKKPSAIALYLLYDKLKNDEGMVQITYDEVERQLGSYSSSVSSANKILLQLGLIERVDERIPGKKIRYKVLKPVFMSSEKRKELFDECGLESNTSIRTKYDGTKVPEEYQQFIDIEKMRKIYQEMGCDNTKFSAKKHLARHCKVDFSTFEVFLETPFGRKVGEIITQVKRETKNQVTKSEVTSIKEDKETEPVPTKKVATKKKAIKKKEKVGTRTTAEYYQLLMSEGHLDLKTRVEIPIDEWTSKQLLRYFCLGYKRRYGVDYSFTGNPFNSKEMKDMLKILTAMTSPLEAKQYLDWAFNEKDKDLQDGISSTGIIAHVRMINEFRKKKVRTTGGLAVDFVNWIKTNEPSYDLSNCRSLGDLRTLKAAVDIDGADKVTERIVEEAKKRGIL